MPGLVLCGVLGAVCVGMMAVQTPAQITGSNLSRTSVNRATGLKVKVDGDPIGTIKAWPATHNPDTSEWLECNGGTFSKTTYPDLFAVLGTTTLPDYTGRFLRGGKAADAGKKFEDTIKTHETIVEDHNHKIEIDLPTINGVITNISVNNKKISSWSTYAEIKTSDGYPYPYESCNNCITDVYYCTYFPAIYNSTHFVKTEYGVWPIIIDYEFCQETFFNNSRECVTSIVIGITPGGHYSGSGYPYINCNGKDDGGIYFCQYSYTSNKSFVFYGVPGNASSNNIISSVETTSSTIDEKLVGVTEYAGELKGTYEGAFETAPKHTIIRYFIKAL